MKKSCHIIFNYAYILFFLLTSHALAQDSTKITKLPAVTKHSTFLKKNADQTFDYFITIPKNDTVTILDIVGRIYFKVIYKNQIGFIYVVDVHEDENVTGFFEINLKQNGKDDPDPVSERIKDQWNYNVYWSDSFVYDDYFNYRIPLIEIIESHKRVPANAISILIDKSDNKLSVLSGGKTLKEFPVMFGKNSIDDKLRQGDGCTPEGTFKVLAKYPHPEYEKFIYINYPNEDSWRKHNLAKKEGKIPSDAKIGGEIGIHGIWDTGDEELFFYHKSIFSAGCIMLKRDDLNELYPYIDLTTKIIIRK